MHACMRIFVNACWTAAAALCNSNMSSLIGTSLYNIISVEVLSLYHWNCCCKVLFFCLVNVYRVSFDGYEYYSFATKS